MTAISHKAKQKLEMGIDQLSVEISTAPCTNPGHKNAGYIILQLSMTTITRRAAVEIAYHN